MPRWTTRRLRRLGSGLGNGAITVITDDCPAGGGRVGAGLLRPRERRAVRFLLQRDRGDGRRRRARCATVSPPTRTWPGCAAGRSCSADAAPARRWTPRPTSPRACWIRFPDLVSEPPRQWLPDMPIGRLHGRPPLPGGGGSDENSSGPHGLRRLRCVRQARAGLLLARRLGIRVAGRRRQRSPTSIATP